MSKENEENSINQDIITDLRERLTAQEWSAIEEKFAQESKYHVDQYNRLLEEYNSIAAEGNSRLEELLENNFTIDCGSKIKRYIERCIEIRIADDRYPEQTKQDCEIRMMQAIIPNLH